MAILNTGGAADAQVRAAVLGNTALYYYPNAHVATKPWVLFRAIEVTSRLNTSTTPNTASGTSGTSGLRIEKVATSIAMPLTPDALQTSYSVSYAETNMGALEGQLYKLTQNGTSGRPVGLEQTDEGIWASIAQFAASAGDLALQGVQAGVADLDAFSKFGIEDLASAVYRERQNPRTEQLFQKVNFRTFKFSWTFMPANPTESDTLRNLITIFKYTMLPSYKAPTLSAFGTLATGAFAYPYEYDILYHNDDYLFRPLRCALTDVSVNYAAADNNTLAFLRPTTPGELPSRPAAVALTLAFQEMQMLTRDQMAQGLSGATSNTSLVGTALLQTRSSNASATGRVYRF